ncbi:MAG: diacylglycerol kinase family protein [Alphaproteobacteria bacterium]
MQDAIDAAAAPALAQAWVVIHNPTAGWRRARRLGRALRRLAAAGIPVSLRRTTMRGDAERFARAAAADPATRALVVAGGDGTINEALNGLGASGLPLGILPLGTANVLAHELAIGATIGRSVDALRAGRARDVRLGIVDGRRFAMMAGAGFDAWVVAAVDPRVKRRFGKGAYLVAGLGVLRRWRPRRYRVTIDGAVHEAGSVICCNGRFYGGRFVLAPEARLDDDLLHVVLFAGAGRGAAVRYVLAMALGLVPRLPDVRVVAGRAITIVAVDGAAEPVQADGDIVAHLPVTIAVAEATTRMLAP